ncbi:MAG: P1 family peptidase [bacterium]|nr:P1 family peptidase [bacterium]
MTINNTLTAVPGIRVGHATHLEGGTGCTVIICPPGTVGGVDQRGGAPGTRETDLLRPLHLVETVNAVVLSGGSAYGLASADGVMRYLEEHDLGYKSAAGFIVPIVPAAILMDLSVGQPGIRPDAAMGYTACEASTTDPVQQGAVGAGTGCRIGPIWGNEFATKGGIGSASIDLGNGLIVAALIAVNAFGDVLDEQGAILGGLRQPPDGNTFANTMSVIRDIARLNPPTESNTVIGVVATNARLSKDHTNKVAQMAQNGVAMAVKPAHTMFDGDTIFALATGEIPANPSVIGAYAAEVVVQAIRNAVRNATSLHGIRAWNQ